MYLFLISTDLIILSRIKSSASFWVYNYGYSLAIMGIEKITLNIIFYTQYTELL